MIFMNIVIKTYAKNKDLNDERRLQKAKKVANLE